MPWLAGDETQYRVITLPAATDFSLAELRSGLQGFTPMYLGYLLEGFTADLDHGKFRAERPALAFRAGWKAVAPAVRSFQGDQRNISPFAAPTAPRPHPTAPLGLTLFSSTFLDQRLGARLEMAQSSLVWAAELNALLGESNPVFCDPVLELQLAFRTPAEQQACLYRPLAKWHRSVRALRALRETR